MGAPEWIARFQTLVASAVQLQSVLAHAVQRLPGFKFDETMTGTVSFTGGDFPAGERELVLQLRAATPRFSDYLRDGRTTLTGTATIPGLADAVPLSGSLWIWPHRQIVRYDLTFSAANQRLRLAGQKDVRLLNFRHTMSTLPAKLYDASEAEVGHGTVLFNWNDLPSFLRSFAPLPLKSSGNAPSAEAPPSTPQSSYRPA